jgi:putative protease
LAHVSLPRALKPIRTKLKIDRIVTPRELSIDEIKTMALACPEGLGLEVFVHGALCYGVSGRCYWSSFLGGKSGLRGRCVQPCRRLYTYKDFSRKFFSCRDLSLDALVKTLLSVPEIKAWKIEGRKKGPHYVFYTVSAYRILRDYADDPAKKQQALGYLSQALGRTGTHYNFLPQRPWNPIDIEGETGSGFFVGNVKGTRQKPYLVPKDELLPGDLLRCGYEDESGHAIYRVGKHVPKRGRLFLKFSSGRHVKKGGPVFLIDRREKELTKILSELEEELLRVETLQKPFPKFRARLPQRSDKKSVASVLYVYRKPDRRKTRNQYGLWLSADALKSVCKRTGSGFWWWLPPVTWPVEEDTIKEQVDLALKKGGQNFVLNAPWQKAFFRAVGGLNIWAGPFCNLSNPLAIETVKSLGFSGAIVSPELKGNDYFDLARHSPLPLGIVISGNWPLCISRTISKDFKTDFPFTSPKGEQAWVGQYGSNYWVYPNWKLDLTQYKERLRKAGFRLFVNLVEPLPRKIQLKKRPGIWNWNSGLL